MNVEAYIVKGMKPPFILGNDFAEQYKISIERLDKSLRKFPLLKFSVIHTDIQIPCVSH
jgi:hypothetical protein